MEEFEASSVPPGDEKTREALEVTGQMYILPNTFLSVAENMLKIVEKWNQKVDMLDEGEQFRAQYSDLIKDMSQFKEEIAPLISKQLAKAKKKCEEKNGNVKVREQIKKRLDKQGARKVW
ncbi:hypothetical protein PMAYCL1PPCAC_09291 [Pristionchus mayeri]|uniref:Uncharacterized protein n=1 Tax=Pristionchus mayeri TaxID=1317129 RepID=A0AAN5CER8_9BILA|nr:hypothetical protein PMAYCL1PPCAC_09291 [Pristionchus mayeri]